MRVKDLGTRPAPLSIREAFSRIVRGHAPAITVQRRELPIGRSAAGRATEIGTPDRIRQPMRPSRAQSRKSGLAASIFFSTVHRLRSDATAIGAVLLPNRRIGTWCTWRGGRKM